MAASYKQLAQTVIPITTGTVIYSKESNYIDRLVLEVSNITSTTASFDLLMGGATICMSTKVDPNSPPMLITDNLVCWSTITANCNVSSACVFTGYAARFN